MAGLLDRITHDLNAALKAKDQTGVSALRFLIANLHNAKISKGDKLSDDEIISEIAKDARRHRESIEAFEKAGREELVAKEKAELEVISRYLPEQLSENELRKVVDDVISQVGATSLSDIGRVMAQVMTEVQGQADGSVVSEIVKEKLAK